VASRWIVGDALTVFGGSRSALLSRQNPAWPRRAPCESCFEQLGEPCRPQDFFPDGDLASRWQISADPPPLVRWPERAMARSQAVGEFRGRRWARVRGRWSAAWPGGVAFICYKARCLVQAVRVAGPPAALVYHVRRPLLDGMARTAAAVIHASRTGTARLRTGKRWPAVLQLVGQGRLYKVRPVTGEPGPPQVQ